MADFFEKLKKGMGIEELAEEKEEEEKEEVKKTLKKEEVKKAKKLEIKTEPIEQKKEKWFEPEGQLAIDVFQTENELIIQSAIAGVKPEELDISIENDVVIIRGSREKSSFDFDEKGNYFTRECYWGAFSREVVLPVEIDPSRAEAIMKNGILILKLPKVSRERKRKIEVKT